MTLQFFWDALAFVVGVESVDDDDDDDMPHKFVPGDRAAAGGTLLLLLLPLLLEGGKASQRAAQGSSNKNRYNQDRLLLSARRWRIDDGSFVSHNKSSTVFGGSIREWIEDSDLP